MKILELFSCSGGATRGLIAAGNVVLATDIEASYVAKNPAGVDSYRDAPAGGQGAPVREPWEWVAENRRSRALVMDWAEALKRYGRQADMVWASPPCQLFSVTASLHVGKERPYEDLIEPVRDALESLGKPYIIENVPQAPIRADVVLCGYMFYGLRVQRHRHFELGAGAQAIQPPHPIHKQTVTDNGRPAEHGKRVGIAGHVSNVGISRAAMGYGPNDKIPTRQLAESIPPQYAYYLATEVERNL